MSVPGFFERLDFGGVTLLNGTISTEIQDTNGVPSEKIIRRSDPWQVEFKWSLSGPGVGILGGNFELELDAEFLSNETWLATRTVAAGDGVPNASGGLDYTATVEVNPNTIPTEGVYRITKHLRYVGPFFGVKTAAFVEGEDIEFY